MLQKVCCLLHAGFLLCLFFGPEDGGNVPLKHWLIFSGLHSVIFLKMELFSAPNIFRITPLIKNENVQQNGI
jgi:hypothetical protein